MPACAGMTKEVWSGTSALVLIQPGEGFVARIPDIGIAQFPAHAVSVIKFTIEARGELHPSRAQITLERKGRECRLDAVRLIEALRQTERIFQRHAGALREILQHRMRRIAQQGYAAFAPLL